MNSRIHFTVNASFRSIFDTLDACTIWNRNCERIKGEGGKWKSNLIWITFQKRLDCTHNIYCSKLFWMTYFWSFIFVPLFVSWRQCPSSHHIKVFNRYQNWTILGPSSLAVSLKMVHGSRNVMNLPWQQVVPHYMPVTRSNALHKDRRQK